MWAPLAAKVDLEFSAPGSLPKGDAAWDASPALEAVLPMAAAGNGYWMAEAAGLAPGSLYRFRLDGGPARPDPASHHQPHGVHGPSRLTEHALFPWGDAGFRPPALSDLILYELHIGTFTPEGTFQAALERLPDLAGLGVTAVQVMPVGQFQGGRNWGYDGVYPFSVQHGYGGPEGFKRFVDASHRHGLAVVLDVVYNHLGPEGNYLRDFGPYFTGRYETPWGEAFNLDGPESDHVRHYFFQNVLHWLERYHVDGFRLDATHAIFDKTPAPFLGQLKELAARYGSVHGREPFFLAESDLNDPRLALPPEAGGLGLSAIYNEDFHHCAHALLTGERQAYYIDYGRMSQLAEALTNGFAYTGQYSPFRRRGHGRDARSLPSHALVAFLQNHDQTGNRAHGERLAALVPFEALKAAATLPLLAPFIPLLFMGEEYGEERPFLYFTSHSDPDLTRSVRRGRLGEFAGFHDGQPPPPDPQDEATFLRSKLQWEHREEARHGTLLAWHRELIALRKALGLGRGEIQRPKVTAWDEEGLLALVTQCGAARLLCLFNLCGAGRSVATAGLGLGSPDAHEAPVAAPGAALNRDGAAGNGAKQNGADETGWRLRLFSADARWGGPGSALSGDLGERTHLPPWSVAVYIREEAAP
ncbi:malto-oligosyltrehalose trehalohydrolase [Fundidesulfovibrio soli]|uniref:malto-oligosyltrehalose trehalohydrolase n=1 Tax=Fundidesulfovibrio soli TaxID=2922716 RepID=UPI001FAEAA9D